jgi:TetR/AcrR family transcriptional regulator, mexJK operon transcriptional repressor
VKVQSRRQEAKQAQIQSAARGLFLKNGYAETSMDAVSAAAGVSKQTLYRYYDTKAALFADVLGELIALPSLDGAARPGRPAPRSAVELREHLVDFAEGYLARVMAPEQLDLLRVVIAEGGRFPDLSQAFRVSLRAAGAEAALATLEAARASGLLAGWVDPRRAARALAGLFLIFIVGDGLLAAAPKPPPRGSLAEVVHIFVSGISAREGECDD